MVIDGGNIIIATVVMCVWLSSRLLGPDRAAEGESTEVSRLYFVDSRCGGCGTLDH